MAASGEVIEFIETYLLTPEGSKVGQPIRLRPWQRQVLEAIYDSPTRRAIISFPRKQGKTAITAMLLLAHLVGPQARRNAQIFSAAQSRDQAAVVFNLAAKMIRMSRDLEPLVHVKDSTKELTCSLTGVHYKALSADASTAMGLSPALAIHDELGQVRGPRSDLYDALETAMGAQEAPLSIVISTQAPTDADLLSTLIDDAKAGHDPRTKLFLFAADAADDPWSEATWRKANPALGDFLNIEEFRETAGRAQRLPSFEASFRNLNLNQRVATLNHFLTPSVWALNEGEPDPSVFEDAPVYAGLDLSSRQDLTALVLVARDAAGVLHVRPRFWMPADGLRDKAERDRAPYDLWRDRGLLTATPGRTVDYAYVARELATLASACNLRTVRFDRWRIDDLRREIERIGAQVPLEEHGQGFKDMSPALEALEAEAINGRLRHGGHPVLTWCAANAVVVPDPAGNRKLDKSKSTGRIDGMVALAMAVGAVARMPDAPAGLSVSDISAFFG